MECEWLRNLPIHSTGSAFGRDLVESVAAPDQGSLQAKFRRIVQTGDQPRPYRTIQTDHICLLEMALSKRTIANEKRYADDDDRVPTGPSRRNVQKKLRTGP
ncbi:hypothetical protein IWQ60_000525 [Tieghemiomyces parasiticus]|uniref:Uncharacterized protein n=1 Tax=Tieghemiomyces parasiticus TaxID=78921 RepID=A0A9W8AMK5_9FUNG|nr:hypothetical protein IWQ60_000525 [Tieghemiomyces parasiticus]